MNTLTLHNEKYRTEKLIPSKWDELFLGQALRILRLQKYPECFSVRFLMLKVLLNLRLLKKGFKSDLFFAVLLKNHMQKDNFKLLALTDWIFEEEKSCTKLLLTKVKKPFKKVRVCKEFDKTQFWQWVHADTNFLAYAQTGDETAIDKMMACFYLKDTFNAETIEEEATFFKNLLSEKKELFLMWYVGNRQVLAQSYDAVFGGEKEETKRRDFGWAGVLDDLSMDVTKMEQVGELNIHNVLFSMNKRIIRDREAQAEAERQNKKTS